MDFNNISRANRVVEPANHRVMRSVRTLQVRYQCRARSLLIFVGIVSLLFLTESIITGCIVVDRIIDRQWAFAHSEPNVRFVTTNGAIDTVLIIHLDNSKNSLELTARMQIMTDSANNASSIQYKLICGLSFKPQGNSKLSIKLFPQRMAAAISDQALILNEHLSSEPGYSIDKKSPSPAAFATFQLAASHELCRIDGDESLIQPCIHIEFNDAIEINGKPLSITQILAYPPPKSR